MDYITKLKGYIPTVTFGRRPNNPYKERTPRPKEIIPPGRVSEPDLPNGLSYMLGDSQLLQDGYDRTFIPLIRNLAKFNSPVGLALNDLVQLTNTGWTLKFDKGVSSEQADKMKKHLNLVMKNWAEGCAGLNGLINKSISQAYISGSVSNEWVPKKDLSGIDRVVFVNPETIYVSLDKKSNRYDWYQKPVNATDITKLSAPVKLNPNTFKYLAINGDTDIPYGFPPFLAALEDIGTQKNMKKNIAFITKQMGVLGFMEMLMEKPMQNRNENDTTYRTRLQTLLKTTKDNISAAISEGVLVGYKEDHEFKFQGISKNVGGLSDIFNLNETQIANGLKISPSSLGVPVAGSETEMSIVFTKMLSQLKNIQNIIRENYEYGITLELG
jgi:hypothetical protein